MVNYIITRNGDESVLVVTLGNKPRSIGSSDPAYASVVDALKAGADEAELDALLQGPAAQVAAAVTLAPGFEYASGVVSFQGTPLDNTLSSYMVALVRDGFPLDSIAAFVRNLFQNPSYRAVRELYSFLQKGQNALTPDGCFLAYKRVNGAYYDCHTEQVLNKPAALLSDDERASLPRKASGVTTALTADGTTEVSMPRFRVDEDPSRTCSSGLHVCSFDYLEHFGGERVIVCKVNPRDVVAIPRDYNDTKMRVCCYEILAELADLRRDTLGSGTLAPDPSRLDIDVFGVETYDDSDASWSEVAAFSSYQEAADEYQRHISRDVGVRVVNKNTGVELLADEPSPRGDGDGDDDDETVINIDTTDRSGLVTVVEADLEDGSMHDEFWDYVRGVSETGTRNVARLRLVRMRGFEVVEVLSEVTFPA